MKRGRRYLAARENVEAGKDYPLEDALTIVKESSKTKFDETVDVAMRLNVDPRHADQMVRGAIALPHGTGKETRVLVLTRAKRRRTPRRLARTTWAPTSTSSRSRRAGPISTS